VSDPRPSFFRDAEIVHDGRVYRFSAAEGKRQQSRGNYWHCEGDPSTWLSVSVVLAVRRKYSKLPSEQLLELGAKALGVTASKLRASIEWHENYMRFHDGDPDYRVL
jgi:hypothetical protein